MNTGPGEKYTAIPIIHDLYVSFCQGKETSAYEYRPFLEKLKVFLVLHRSNMGARPSHQQSHRFDKTPYKNHTGFLTDQLKVHRFFVMVMKLY
jgi:hypothetical protein